MKNSIILIILLFSLFSCNKKENEIIIESSDFPKTINLKSSRINKIKQLTPSSICVFDSIIMVTDYTQNPRMHFYNKNTFDKITEYGVVGEGPEEFYSPECNCQTFKKESTKDTFIMIYEFGYGMIHEVNLNSILRKENTSKIDKYYLNPQIYNADNVYYRNNYAIGEATDNKDVKYFKTELSNTVSFTKLGVINNDAILNKAPIEDRINYDRSFMGYSEDQNKFVSAYLRYNKIKILDSELNEMYTILYGNEENGPNTLNLFSEENIYYFKQPYCAKNKFYIPYLGVKNKVKDIPQEIHVFDYKGTPLIKYILDMPVKSFTIDESNNKLYAITGEDDNSYVVYNL